MLGQGQLRIEGFLLRRRRWIWSGVLAVLALLYLSVASNELGGILGGDNANYLFLAKALAQGQGYVDLHLPNHPPHTKYPPLFPLLLAPFSWLGRNRLFGIHLFIAGLGLVVPFGLAGWARRQGYSETASLAVLILVATIPRYYEFQLNILSEVPFMAFCYFTLWWMSKAGSAPKTRDLMILTLATLAACFTRTAGITLAAAIGIELFRRPELRRLRLARIPWPVFFLGMVAIALMAWSLRNRWVGGTGLGYFQEFLLKDAYRPQDGYAGLFDLGSRVYSRAYFYLTIMAMQVALGYTYSPTHRVPFGFFVPLLIPIGIGFLSRLRKPDRSAEWFFLFSALLMSAWWFNETRFLLPLLPLASFYLALGVRTILGWLAGRLHPPSARVWGRGITLLIGLLILFNQLWVVAGLVKGVHTDRLEPAHPIYLSNYGWWREPVINWSKYEWNTLTESEIRLFTRYWIINRVAAQKVPPGMVILSRKPTITAWISGRPSVCYLFNEDAKAQWKFLRRNQVSYVLALGLDEYMEALLRSCPQCFREVAAFEEAYPVLYQIEEYPASIDSPKWTP